MSVRLPTAMTCLLIVVGALGNPPARAGNGHPPLAELDAYVEEVREEWRVVGLAIAIVKDDQVVYAKGFGDRALGQPGAVDEDTVFAIGSNSKAFTAAGLGILVDEKRLDWDDKVAHHLPWFELYDPYVTREITVRDLLSHRSGLGRRGDLNWYATEFGREEIVRRIRYLEPNSSFRSQSGYQNTMFLAAGLVNEAIAEMSWDEWIASRIFDPLGMMRSRTSVAALEGMPNVASPHHIFDGVRATIPYRVLANVAPAGSILSSVSDMSRWLRVMLGRGEFEGNRIFSDAVVKEVWSPNIVYPLGPEAEKLFPMSHLSTYGLGWGLRDYRGRLLASHSGGIDGMLSRVAVLPEEQLGVVILTNTTPDGGAAHDSIVYHVIDSYLEPAEPTDWRGAMRDLVAARRTAAAAVEARRRGSRVAETTPSRPLAAYAGVYEDEMYGSVTVSLEGEALVLRRHSQWVGDLKHWHYDTFEVSWRDRYMGEQLVTFGLSAQGAVDALDFAEWEEFHRVEAREEKP